MDYKIKEENGFKYLEVGSGPVLLILHGLFGAMSNFREVINAFSGKYRILIPLMPIYEKSRFKSTVTGLKEFVHEFAKVKELNNFTLLGNSLGGHIALVYSLEYPKQVSSLILTASSGLFENGMGSTFPKRGSMDYVKERVEYTFYSPKTATKEIIDSVFKTINNNISALRILRYARSAQNHNMRSVLAKIKIPTLLIWGLNDNITPPRVAHEFNRLLPHSELHFIDKCGHAPMMERPKRFNKLLSRFLPKYAK